MLHLPTGKNLQDQHDFDSEFGALCQRLLSSFPPCPPLRRVTDQGGLP